MVRAPVCEEIVRTYCEDRRWVGKLYFDEEQSISRDGTGLFAFGGAINMWRNLAGTVTISDTTFTGNRFFSFLFSEQCMAGRYAEVNEPFVVAITPPKEKRSSRRS